MRKIIFSFLLFSSFLFSENYKIFVNKKEKILYILDDKKIIKKFSVGVGRKGHETPFGSYKIKNKIKNPGWCPPSNVKWLSESEREYLKKHKYFPYGHPMNPLRYYWIGLEREDGKKIGIGIHGIIDDRGIGKASSHGCIRAKKDCLEFIVKNIPIGTEVIIHNFFDYLVSKKDKEKQEVGNSKKYYEKH